MIATKGTAGQLMGRAVLLLLTTVVALLLASGAALLASSDKEAEAQAQFRTVTKTFSNPTAVIQPSSAGVANPYPSAIRVGNLRRAKVLDVNLTLKNYSHSFSEDVDVLLVGPRGQKALVMSDVGNHFGEPTDTVTFTLDDEGENLLCLTCAIPSGAVKPFDDDTSSFDSDTFPAPAPATATNSKLSVFDGTNPRGTWKLFISNDHGGGTSGQVAGGYSLRIKAKVRT